MEEFNNIMLEETSFLTNSSTQLIQTAILVGSIIIAQLLSRRVVGRTLKMSGFNDQRKRLIVRLINTLSVLIGLVFLGAIWGVNRDQMLVFISSSLTILGIGFFAQWSILSNITSALILFFSHPMKIGSVIKIVDKDFPIEGTITDITFFFVHIETKDKERISLPSNLLLQKTISLIAE